MLEAKGKQTVGDAFLGTTPVSVCTIYTCSRFHFQKYTPITASYYRQDILKYLDYMYNITDNLVLNISIKRLSNFKIRHQTQFGLL